MFRNIHAYILTYLATVNEEIGHEFESKERHMRGFEQSKGKMKNMI